MVCVDPLMSCVMNRYWKWPEVSHLVADTDEELHAFAASIGLRRAYHQVSTGGLSHYDLTRGKRTQSVSRGAVEIDATEMVRRFIRPAQLKLCEVSRNES